MADLLKGKGKGKGKAPVERSDEELLALMDELFSGDEDEEAEEDMDKGSGYSYGAKSRKGADPRAELLRRASEAEDEDEDEDEDEEAEDMGKGRQPKGRQPELFKAEEEDEELEGEEDMEKGKSERRAMMDRAYSLIDDLSEEQLRAFLSEHVISKAIAMMVLGNMPTSDLKELVSFEDANGSPVGGPVDNPHGV